MYLSRRCSVSESLVRCWRVGAVGLFGSNFVLDVPREVSLLLRDIRMVSGAYLQLAWPWHANPGCPR